MEKEVTSSSRVQVPLVSEDALISSFSLDRIAEELLQSQSEPRKLFIYGSPSFSFAKLLPRMGSIEALVLEQEQIVERVHEIQQREMLQPQDKHSESNFELLMLQQALTWLGGKTEKA